MNKGDVQQDPEIWVWFSLRATLEMKFTKAQLKKPATFAVAIG